MSVDRDGAKEGAAEHARRLAVERAEMEAATSIPGHVRAKAEIENLEISEERRRAKTEPTANYALRELDRDDDDHVFEDYYRQKLGVRLMNAPRGRRRLTRLRTDELGRFSTRRPIRPNFGRFSRENAMRTSRNSSPIRFATGWRTRAAAGMTFGCRVSLKKPRGSRTTRGP